MKLRVEKNNAKASGLKRYFTGVPCRNGHIAERFSNSGHCVLCLEFARRQWKKLNFKKMKATRKAWEFANLEKQRAMHLAWQRANPDKKAKHHAVWYTAHREVARARRRLYDAANPEKAYLRKAKRRAIQIGASIGLTKEDRNKLIEIYRQCRLMTKLTGVQYHVDHKIALANGGAHHPDNLQLLTAAENYKKGAR